MSLVYTGLIRLLVDRIVQILLAEIVIRPRAQGLKNILKVKPAWDLRPLPGLGRLEISPHDPPKILALLHPGMVLLHIETLMPHRFPLGIRRFPIDEAFILAPSLLCTLREIHYHLLDQKKITIAIRNICDHILSLTARCFTFIATKLIFEIHFFMVPIRLALFP